MRTLRALLLVAGLAIAATFAAIGPPQAFAVAMPCALLLFLVGAGLAASDCVPVRRWRLLASLAAMAVLPLLVLRPAQPVGVVAGVAIALLQVRALRG